MPTRTAAQNVTMAKKRATEMFWTKGTWARMRQGTQVPVVTPRDSATEASPTPVKSHNRTSRHQKIRPTPTTTSRPTPRYSPKGRAGPW